MLLTRAASSLLLAGLALAPVTGAQAAPPICQGRPATVVQAPGSTVTTGTDGDDVVVASGVVEAGAGDDLVCTGYGRTVAGPGDDVVVSTTGPTQSQQVDLGPGDDVYRGGAGRDSVGVVFDVFAVPTYVADPGRDRIATGDGDDVVLLGTGDRRAERVDLGAGADVLLVGPRGWRAASEVTGGAGRDVLQVSAEQYGRRPYRLDLGATTVSGLGGPGGLGGPVAAGWSGFESYAADGARRVEVVGSVGRDDLALTEAGRFVVDLAAGRDRLLLDGRAVATTGSFDLGGGRDLLELVDGSGRWDVDLARSTVALPGFPDGRSRLHGADDVRTSGPARVAGDDGPNEVRAGCGRVAGRGGDDVLVVAGRCSGRAVALGGPGRDRCRAEVRVRCEG